MLCLCHERAVTNVLFCCRHSDPFGRATFVSHTYFSYYYHEWIAFRESSHVVINGVARILVWGEAPGTFSVISTGAYRIQWGGGGSSRNFAWSPIDTGYSVGGG